MPLTQKPYDCYIEVEYLPFPSEAKRQEAYEVHVDLFLKAKERQFIEMLKDKIPDEAMRAQHAEKFTEKLVENLLSSEKVNNYSQKVNSLLFVRQGLFP